MLRSNLASPRPRHHYTLYIIDCYHVKSGASIDPSLPARSAASHSGCNVCVVTMVTLVLVSGERCREERWVTPDRVFPADEDVVAGVYRQSRDVLKELLEFNLLLSRLRKSVHSWKARGTRNFWAKYQKRQI